MAYTPDYFNYRRRPASLVKVGSLSLGGNSPIRLQSMTNTSTLDSEASALQIDRIVAAGGELVRLTAQGSREAENLADIRQRTISSQVPLVADIHFNPKVAELAAHYVEKVRINPGNFADPIPEAIRSLPNEEEREQAIAQHLRQRFLPFLAICKQHGTAIRIGVNHGSLSARMTDRYGDTPEGMVASCMEYLRICVEENFLHVVISIKASNTLIMVQTVRLLVQTMEAENMHFPLHLGVTEAGEGNDGRIKSAVGIGSLLADGIGDTIRVSLSEDPEREIPVARKLVDYIQQRAHHPRIEGRPFPDFDSFHYHRRESVQVGNIGNGQAPVVIVDASSGKPSDSFEPLPDFIYVGENVSQIPLWRSLHRPFLCCAESCPKQADCYPLYEFDALEAIQSDDSVMRFLRVEANQIDDDFCRRIKGIQQLVLMIHSRHINAPAQLRAAFHCLLRNNCNHPVVTQYSYDTADQEALQLYAASDFGFLLLDGFSDGICLQAVQQPTSFCSQCMFDILQAARARISKTEYISCPSCGRTLFDLQTTIARVKAATAQFTGIKIAIMGCIVNGPGEMADADYGYIGAGRSKISLYKGKQCVEKNLPEEEAVEHLLALIASDQS